MKSKDELRDLGVIVTKNPPQLQAGSVFEPPCVIQADLAPMNHIRIGAFTGIFGGRVGHSSIGRYCSIAPGVDIASDQHPQDWLSSSMVQYVRDVHGWGAWLSERGYKYSAPKCSFRSNSTVQIGNDVWIGKNAIIRSGVRIGDGAIVAAGAVVVSDVPDYAVVAGVPAKVKKMRFSETVVERLRSLRWWDYQVLSLGIKFSNIDEAIRMIEDALAEGALPEYRPTVISVGDAS